MASKALLRRKKDEKKNAKKLVVSKEQEQLEKCPVFKVHYLGKVPARGEYGREFIDEPVETLLKLKDRLPRLPKTTLQITDKGFRFSDVNGPFGKERHISIPIHHICYGVADEQNPQVFAIITRTDSNPENSLLECHAFLCDRRKVAAQITYWLLRTFLQVFEDLQRRRRTRQARKMRQQQIMGALAEQPAVNSARLATEFDNNLQMYDVPPSSPTGSIAPDIYSITVEGSKENGELTAVRLTKNRAPVFGNNSGSQPADQTRNIGAIGGNKFATLPVMRSSSHEEPTGSGARRRQPVPQMFKSQDSLNYHPPLKQSNSADTSFTPTPSVTLRKARNAGPSPSRPHSFSGGKTNTTLSKNTPNQSQTPKNQAPTLRNQAPSLEVETLEINGLSNLNAPLHHQRQERARYMKNVNAIRTTPAKPPGNQGRGRPANLRLSSVGTSSSSVSESSYLRSTSQDDSDFIFIRMLQEEFSEVGSSDANSTIHRMVAPHPNKEHKQSTVSGPKSGPSSTSPAPPLDQKLASEDIEKRIREWLKRTSPDAEIVSFDDSGLDRISLAGTLARHNSPRVTPAATPRLVPSVRSTHTNITRKSVAATFDNMPSDREYF